MVHTERDTAERTSISDIPKSSIRELLRIAPCLAKGDAPSSALANTHADKAHTDMSEMSAPRARITMSSSAEGSAIKAIPDAQAAEACTAGLFSFLSTNVNFFILLFTFLVNLG